MKKKIVFASSALGLATAIYFFQLSEASESVIQNNPVASASNFEPSPETLIASAFTEVVATDESVEDLFDAYKKAPQIFTISNDAPVSITGAKGTLIEFPANALVHEDGSSPKEPISLALTECYDMTEILLNKLSTTSNGDLIETAGMVYIEAIADGKKLKIAEGLTYSVSFPQSTEKEDFQLFYGKKENSGVINWTLADTTTSSIASRNNGSVLSNMPENDTCFIQINRSYFRRNTKITLMDYYTWTFLDGTLVNNWFVANFNPPLEMVDEFCALNYQTEVTLKLDPDGWVKERHLSKASVPKYDLEILKMIDRMPQWNMRSFMDKYDEDHSVILQFGREIGVQRGMELTHFEKEYGRGDTLELGTVAKADMDFFIYNANQLGWLNCDRFVKFSKIEDFFVNVPFPDKTSVSCVFTGLRGVMLGFVDNGVVVFNDVPSNQAVRIIAVEASGGKPRMASVSTNTSKGKLVINEMKPFKLAELKTALRGV